MGKAYAIANQKGGVGKTTTAVNVGACIAEAGYDTLLVDADPQANATVGLGIPRSATPGLYEVLTGEASAEQAVRETGVSGLHVLPAGAGLAAANIELPRVEGFEQCIRVSLAPLRERYRVHTPGLPAVTGAADRQRACWRRGGDRPRAG